MIHKDSTSINLVNHFLISTSCDLDNRLSGSVIYICEHNSKGALGLVINKPTEFTLGNLFERINLSLEISTIKDKMVFFGGSVQSDCGFILHPYNSNYGSTIKLGELALTTSRDILQDVADGRGPNRLLISLGYSGWSAGQLEDEIYHNDWISVPAESSIIFDLPPKDRYRAALGLLGINNLTSLVDYACYD
ncbi:transcriptional regulator [Candidatus Kinetoplastibacterium blastocrithidii TCC012E]|uniref:UPF0301 protein BCUE_0047 n=1 Tax=Candidatus Kinetoplastidibacterium blastocrithidiae TCC012E TaxID=1208922 RepID=M1ME92_9PROT|nr:YqgE/AlgH family protein [Candidatus Kinetoplastibacterium blastocrithidii]AFZ83231.1 transcriptional regulator [Candidatus Kinetoplastibacterium blastocrithidii (ex Strigomonas culicis)]AGF50045.1 transcriptional regulator [Candidatus Kinetoplastibacterium blastocrithidii TCC012E]